MRFGLLANVVALELVSCAAVWQQAEGMRMVQKERFEFTNRGGTVRAGLGPDGVMVAAALSLAGAAGFLQYQVSSGERGINAFLGKEKQDNPFYARNFKVEKKDAPAWLSALRLPELPFVEIYGQPKEGVRLGSAALARLYRDLDDAVEREDYACAAEVKAAIDRAAAEEHGNRDDV